MNEGAPSYAVFVGWEFVPIAPHLAPFEMWVGSVFPDG